jgi:hypothetical protein
MCVCVCVFMQMMGNKQDRGCVLLMSKDRRDKYKKYRNIFNWREEEKDKTNLSMW